MLSPHLIASNPTLRGIDTHDPSLVLYLPLWYPDLETTESTIISKDKNRHSCAVTGATWGYQGRTFDGSDDKIQKTVANFRSGDSSGSIIVWFKTTATDSFLFTSANTVGNASYFNIRAHNTSNLYVQQKDNGGASDIVNGNIATNDGVWHMGAVVSSGTAYSIYVDNVACSLAINTGANSGDWFADTTLRDNFVLGALVESASTFSAQTIGEVLIYSRALSVSEISRIYQATKRRYQ